MITEVERNCAAAVQSAHHVLPLVQQTSFQANEGLDILTGSTGIELGHSALHANALLPTP